MIVFRVKKTQGKNCRVQTKNVVILGYEIVRKLSSFPYLVDFLKQTYNKNITFIV
jgi:hypothetical protein